jgi:hypothetical protein
MHIIPYGNQYCPFDIVDRPGKKRQFEQICAAQDLTSSQVVRRLIRQYIEQHACLISQEALAGETIAH